jgi:hypothetical protein
VTAQCTHPEACVLQTSVVDPDLDPVVGAGLNHSGSTILLQTLRALPVHRAGPRTFIYSIHHCRALACGQNPCGGVDAAHQPQRVCSRHCAHRVYAEQGLADTSTLPIFAAHLPVYRIRVVGWMPRTNRSTCAPGTARTAYTQSGAAHIHLSYTVHLCRTLACVQNPCGGVDAAHQPQPVCSRHCAHRVSRKRGATNNSLLYLL